MLIVTASENERRNRHGRHHRDGKGWNRPHMDTLDRSVGAHAMFGAGLGGINGAITGGLVGGPGGVAVGLPIGAAAGAFGGALQGGMDHYIRRGYDYMVD